MEKTEILLKVENLKKYFHLKKNIFSPQEIEIKAVDGVSLSIPRGKTLGLVGESGSGKSTLGRIILRLDNPEQGKIFFAGEEITHFPKNKLRLLRQKMQIIFQDPFASLSPRLSVGQIIGEGLKVFFRDKGKSWMQGRIQELLKIVGLPEYCFNRYPHEFSGGQRQRIGIARAISVYPEFLVLDEPVSSLDVSIQAQILNLLLDLQEQFNLTYLFITHDLRIVRQMSDEIAVMHQGKIVEKSSCAQIFTQAKHPYTQTLLEALI